MDTINPLSQAKMTQSMSLKNEAGEDIIKEELLDAALEENQASIERALINQISQNQDIFQVKREVVGIHGQPFNSGVPNSDSGCNHILSVKKLEPKTKPKPTQTQNIKNCSSGNDISATEKIKYSKQPIVLIHKLNIHQMDTPIELIAKDSDTDSILKELIITLPDIQRKECEKGTFTLESVKLLLEMSKKKELSAEVPSPQSRQSHLPSAPGFDNPNTSCQASQVSQDFSYSHLDHVQNQPGFDNPNTSCQASQLLQQSEMKLSQYKEFIEYKKFQQALFGGKSKPKRCKYMNSNKLTQNKPFRKYKYNKVCTKLSWQCSHCPYTTNKKLNIPAHLRTHTKKNCKKQSWQCNHCPYATNKKQNIQAHLRTHTNQKPFRCKNCPYAASQKSRLKRHLRIHTGEKPFKCIHCSYSSAFKNNLQAHLRTHTGERPYKCKFCSYASSGMTALQVHLRKHTGERPFRCIHCPYTAVRKTNLQDHLRIHSGEKPFHCSQCSYTATTKSSLHVHLRRHTGEKPFKCMHCSYAATRNSTLKGHIRTHTGEKPFKCMHCPYAASRKSVLTDHVRKHTGKNPLKCMFCSYAAFRKSAIIAHAHIHAGEKKIRSASRKSVLKDHLRIPTDKRT